MTDIKTKIRTQIASYSSGYNDLTHLRAAVTLIPKIGSMIDLYLSTPGQRFIQERLFYMIDQLQEQMNEVYENAIDKRLFETEEGFDLVNKTFAAAARTRQKEKLILFAKILSGAFTIKEKEYEPELYLKIVDELSTRELEVAFLLYNVKEERKIKIENEDEAKNGMSNDPFWFSKYYPQYSREELKFILIRLEKTGLIKEVVGSFIGYSGEQYNPTSLFTDFISFIKQNE